MGAPSAPEVRPKRPGCPSLPDPGHLRLFLAPCWSFNRPRATWKGQNGEVLPRGSPQHPQAEDWGGGLAGRACLTSCAVSAEPHCLAWNREEPPPRLWEGGAQHPRPS